MQQSSFVELLELLTPRLLRDQQRRRRDGVSPAEQLAIFLDYAATGLSQARQAVEWQRSQSTIHKIRHRVALAIVKVLYKDTVKQEELLPIIRGGDARFRHFAGCVGALDGSHIGMVVPRELAPKYRNRKGFTSMNLLATCNFNLEVTYCLPGAEGCAHDGAVLGRARNLRTPAGGYFLGDAGYALTEMVLTPFRGVRYHLQEWAKAAGLRPQTPEELFNLRHAQLRNVIERLFGVLKRRFKVLKHGLEWSIPKCNILVLSLISLHNFLREADPTTAREHEEAVRAEQSAILRRIAGLSVPVSASLAPEISGDEADAEDSDDMHVLGPDSSTMATKRYNIAHAMWREYVTQLALRGLTVSDRRVDAAIAPHINRLLVPIFD